MRETKTLDLNLDFYINGRPIKEENFLEILTTAISKEYIAKHGTFEEGKELMAAFEGALEGMKILERITEQFEEVEVYGMMFAATQRNNKTA